MELNFFSTIIIFIAGVCLGSFLNVVIDRFATNRSIVKGRSYCEACNKTLEIRDLIPLLSYILLRGRCRFCNERISPRLFLVELMTGFISVGLLLLFSSSSLPVIIILYPITLLLISIFFIDLEYGIIPDKLTILLTILSVILVFFNGQNLLNHFISAVSSLIFFIGLYIVTKGRGMGMGDVKISFSLGMLLGYPLIIYGLYLAFLTGAIVSIILVLWKKKSFRGGTVPFGPFLTASTLFTLFFGNSIIYPLANLIL